MNDLVKSVLFGGIAGLIVMGISTITLATLEDDVQNTRAQLQRVQEQLEVMDNRLQTVREAQDAFIEELVSSKGE